MANFLVLDDKAVGVPLTQQQFDALVAFSVNVGVGAKGMSGSTLVRILNQGNTNKKDIDAAFMMWIQSTVDGKKIKVEGLKNRRRHEINLFFDGKYSW